MAAQPSGASDYNFKTMRPNRALDVVGRQLVVQSQNIYEADFEYGTQPLRWEALTNGSGTIAAVSSSGGVQMTIGTGTNDIAIRQSRPYHRYQPGKTMKMATACNFGGAITNQRQRVGFFDDGNGIFFEQADPTTTNPLGMFAVYRSNIGGSTVDTRITYENWSDPYGKKGSLDWTKIQMIWIEYAWYGAGGLRWGVTINGDQFILHEIGAGNNLSQPWSRTGSLPVRYELRNIGTVTGGTTFYHYGVSVLVEGGIDSQRGFTYSYGMASQVPQNAVGSNKVRIPILSIQPRTMGTQEYTQASAAVSSGSTTTMTVASYPSITSITVSGTTATLVFSANHNITNQTTPVTSLTISGATPAALNGFFPVTYVNATTVTYQVPSGTTTASVVGSATPWTTGQWVGKYVNFPGLGGTTGLNALITANTANTLTFQDIITGNALGTAISASQAYTIGYINRGQLLPVTLVINSSAVCQIELIASTPTSPITLTGASFVALNTLGSVNSFATRDVSATAMSGGEVVYAFVSPSGGAGNQQFDLSNFFPLVNTIRGNYPDILTVAVTTPSGTGASVGAYLVCQEKMS